MSAESTPTAPRGAQKRRRQDPVSCQCCRRKKLKCDRKIPCSSCVARRLECSYESYAETEVATPPSINRGSKRTRISAGAITTVLQSVAGGAAERSGVTASHIESAQIADSLETAVTHGRIPTTGLTFSTTNGGAAPSLYTGANHLPQVPIPNTSTRTQLSQMAVMDIDLSTTLPEKDETRRLFQYYCDYINYQYHLIVPQMAEAIITSVYHARLREEPVPLKQMALVFSIVATASFFELSSSGSTDLAHTRARETAHLTGVALIQVNHIACPSVEGLQAAIIIARHLPSPLMPPDVASLFTHATLVAQGRALGLHSIDSPQSQQVHEENRVTKTSLELRRRLWWDLVSCDWMMAFFSGPLEWSYSIQPRHMNTRKPLNTEDEDIESGADMPFSTPTCMSYALCRLRLAEVCREFVDGMASDALHGCDPSYETVLKLNRSLEVAYSEIPDYFRLDPASRRAFDNLSRERPQLAWQRMLLHQGYLWRFCRLHQRYFVCGAKDPRLSYSHTVALQSARKILEVKRIMDEEEPHFMPESSLFWVVTHHVFMAAVILLIDACFNWDDILAERRRHEILDACRMLSHAQQSSGEVRDGIDEMMGIMNKYWRHGQARADSDAMGESVNMTAAPIADVGQPHIRADGINDVTDSLNLEDAWSGMLDGSAGMDLEPSDWMQLLDDLTNVA